MARAAADSAVFPRSAAMTSLYRLDQREDGYIGSRPWWLEWFIYICVDQTDERVLGLGNNSGDRPFADFGFCNGALAFSLTILDLCFRQQLFLRKARSASCACE